MSPVRSRARSSAAFSVTRSEAVGAETLATAGGAVAGAAIGANAGGGGGYSQNVQRCSTVPSGRPDYWDVTYNFKGVIHHVQMSAPPGQTVTVNDNGEPRG